MRKNAIDLKHLVPLLTCIFFHPGFAQSTGNNTEVAFLSHSLHASATGNLPEINFAFTVTGKITGTGAEALPGVVLSVKGLGQSTVTNAAGVFTITVPNGNETLVITHVGYLPQEIAISNRATINILLAIDPKEMQDVVVVGYGTRKKTDVTGAVASIQGDKLRSVPTPNVTSALQGRIPGVEVAASSFRPGSGSRIRIRGNRSLNASNEPLYVVDGVPVSYTIDDMSPLDIESIDVLKDASSTAIYGVRGANGVVQITTRKARSGKVSVQYEGYTSFDNILKKIHVFDAPQLADAWRQAFYADRVYNFAQNTASPNNYFPNAAADAKLFGGTSGNAMWNFIKDAYQFTTFDRLNNVYVAVKRPTSDQEKTLMANLGLPVLTEIDAYDPSKIKGFDWQNAALRQGITNSQSINISVGTDKVRSSFGGSYYKQKGIEYGQDYTRYTVSNNTEFRPVKYFTFGNSISYSNGVQNVGPSQYANALGMLPFTQPYDSLGNFDLYPNDDQQIVNGLNDANTVFNEVKANRIFGNLYAEINIFKGLKYRTVFGIDYRNARNGRFNGAISSVRQGAAANASYAISNNTSWTYDNILTYDFKVKSDHSFNITLLHEMQSLNKTDSLNMSGENLIFEQQKWYSLNRNTSGTVTGSGSYSAQQLLSFMGRVEYGFRGKYLLTLSNRYDVSSVLAAGKQGEFFPSAAFAWKVDNEEFFKRQDLFSFAKLRLGIGRVGNSSIGPYQTNGPLDFTYYNWGNGTAAIGSAPTTFRVPNLTWEKTTTKNLGLEFGLLKGRINASVDLYNSSTTDVLQNQIIPATNGVTNVLVNLGEVSNKGIDIGLSTVNINSPSGFKWTTDIVFSRNKEAILSLDATGKDNLNNLWFIGQPLRVYYNYQSGGIYQFADTAKGGYLRDYLWPKGTNAANTAFRPGKIRVVDVNGDSLINSSDKQILGSDNSNWTGSITNTVSYKNLTLNFNIYYRRGGMYRVPRPGLVGRYQSTYANYWTPTNPSNDYQQPTRTSDIPLYWEAQGYRNGTYARVRNISLTYSFPESFVSRLKASNLAIYVNAVNPFLFHNASEYDPETIPYSEQFAASTGNPGPNSYSYRSMVVGLKLGL